MKSWIFWSMMQYYFTIQKCSFRPGVLLQFTKSLADELSLFLAGAFSFTTQLVDQFG